MADAALILVIEDEIQIRRFLRASLSSHGFRLNEAGTAREGLNLAATNRPELVLLDLGLPDLDGLEVTQRLRSWSDVPIIVLSARGQEQDKIAALDAGADDYLTKPFGVGELLARLRVALRHAAQRQQAETTPVFQLDALRIDLNNRQVSIDGLEVHLTPIEYKLLSALARYAGKVVTHNQLLRQVWGLGYGDQTQYLRVYMGQLRHKLEVDFTRPHYILTEPGVGYRLRVVD